MVKIFRPGISGVDFDNCLNFKVLLRREETNFVSNLLLKVCHSKVN